MQRFRLPDIRNREIAQYRASKVLRTEADRDLAKRSIAGIVSYFVLWLIIYFTIIQIQINRPLLEFLGYVLAAISVGRLYLALDFNRIYAGNPRLWRMMFGTGTILTAAIWGGVSVLALNFNGLGPTSMKVMLCLAGIAAGGIVSLAPAAKLGGIFVMLLLFPIIPFELFIHKTAETGIGLLFLTFLVVMIVLWRRLYIEYWRALAGRAELVLAKEAAEAATLAKGQFIANVSHELRTPLTSIIGSLGMFESYPMPGLPEQAKTLIDLAYQNSNRLSLLINDILDFEKLNADRLEFRNQPMALGSFLQRALELNQSLADAHHVTFRLEPAEQELDVIADEQRLMQVMSNLLSNAAKFSPEGEQVLVSAKLRQGMARISVIDHGPGVPENFRTHIFEKFAQAKSSTTDKSSGTGLGLAISKAIIEKMSGTIGFDSVTGKGATFYFDLPLAAKIAAK